MFIVVQATLVKLLTWIRSRAVWIVSAKTVRGVAIVARRQRGEELDAGDRHAPQEVPPDDAVERRRRRRDVEPTLAYDAESSPAAVTRQKSGTDTVKLLAVTVTVAVSVAAAGAGVL